MRKYQVTAHPSYMPRGYPPLVQPFFCSKTNGSLYYSKWFTCTAHVMDIPYLVDSHSFHQQNKTSVQSYCHGAKADIGANEWIHSRTEYTDILGKISYIRCHAQSVLQPKLLKQSNPSECVSAATHRGPTVQLLPLLTSSATHTHTDTT